MKRKETPDILKKFRDMKLRKELTVLLAFFVMISTSYIMIHPGEALNNSTARSFMFFNEEDGVTEETAVPTEVPDMNALLDADRDSGATAEEPAEETPAEEVQNEETASAVPEEVTSAPTSTPAETVVPTLEPASTAEATAEATGTPEALESADPAVTAEAENTSGPFGTASTEPVLEETSTPEATASASPEPSASATPEATASATPEATASAEPTATPEAEEEEVLYPAVDFGEITPLEEDGTETKEDIKVVIKAPEGAFPEGTTVKVVLVRDTEVLEAIEKAAVDATEDLVEVKEVKAVDITFFTEAGEEVQPKKAIAVSFKSAMIEESNDTTVVHVEQDKENDNQILEAKAVNKIEAPSQSELVDEISDNEVVIEAESFSVYGIVGTETITGGFVAADGSTYEVTVTYDATAGIPLGSTLSLIEYSEDSEEYQKAKIKIDEFKANEVTTDDEDNVEEAAESEDDEKQYGFSALGISIIDPDGKEIEPNSEVMVSIIMKSLPEGFEADDLLVTMEVHHLAEVEGNVAVELVAGSVGDGSIISADEGGASVEFTTDSFSTYTITWGQAQNPRNRSVVLHFMDATTGQETDGITLNGTPVDNGTIARENFVAVGQEFDLSQFQKAGYTLSNVHIGTYNDLSGGTNTNTIIGNSIRRTNNGTLQYRSFQNVDDEAMSAWVDFGNGNTAPYTPTRTAQGNSTTGNTNNYTNNGITDIYLVYNPVVSSGGGTNPGDDEIPDLGEIGRDKSVTSNHDGTYTLELSVTGRAKQKKDDPDVNVIFVLDLSSSMDRNGRPWLTNTKNQLYTMTEALAEYNTNQNPDAVEMALITFNATSTTRTFGNTGNWTTSAQTFRTTLSPLTTGSGTNWAMALDQATSLNKDEDPTYVIFLTDGAPSRYWHSNTAFYSDGEGCYLGARDEARELVRSGKVFYGIFAYSSDTRNLLSSLVNYAYNNDSASNTYYTDASDMTAIQDKLDEILEAIKMNFAYADVTISDGITGMTSTVFEEVDPDSFTYKVTYRDYTSVTAYTEEEVEIEVSGTGSNQTIHIPSVTYGVSDGTTYTRITTEEYTVTGARFHATDPNSDYDGKAVSWDIVQTNGQPYMLEQDWTYTFDAIIWPSQQSYDLVAALNNEIISWGDSYTYTDGTGTHTISFEEYESQIEQGTPYELKTNTHAEVTYQKYKATIVGDTIEYEPVGNPVTSKIEYEGEMALDGTEIVLEKIWDTSLSTEDYENIDHVDLYILEDNPTGAGFDKTNPSTYYKKVVLEKDNDWKTTVAIAPGVFDGHTFKTTGHTYSVTEPELDSHFEFNMTPVHPMLDGTTLNIEKDMVDVYDASSPEDYKQMDYNEEAGTASYSVNNTLKGGINLKKVIDVPDEYKAFVNEDQLFSFTIRLFDENGDPVYTGEEGHDTAGSLGTRYYTEDGQTIRGSIPTTGEVTLTMKASESIRIVNVPAGTYYTIEEGDLSTTVYEFEKSEWLVRHHPEIGSDDWAVDYSETITNSQITNSHVIRPNAENNVTFTNTYEGTGYIGTKIWDDNNSADRPKTVTLQLLQKVTGSAEEAVPYGDPVIAGIDDNGDALEGTTVTDDNTWIYTWKGLPLKAFVNGSAVTYEYSFEESVVPDGYSSIMSEDGTTVTNKRSKKIKFVKQDMDGNALEGAKFTLTIDDTEYSMISSEDGVLVTDDDDKISTFFVQIKANACILEETDVPGGYNKLTQPVIVTVRADGVSYNYQYIPDEVETETDIDGTTVYIIKIKNSSGVELPMTGGPGALLYTLSGIALMLGAALMYGFRLRRRERRFN